VRKSYLTSFYSRLEVEGEMTKLGTKFTEKVFHTKVDKKSINKDWQKIKEKVFIARTNPKR
jgi:hypothetical protein